MNCPFFYKTGSCRHGAKCSKKHLSPSSSQTILLERIYVSPRWINPTCSDDDVKEHLELFVCDMFEELHRYGFIEEMYVCENLNHLRGNFYCIFKNIESAEKALEALSPRAVGTQYLPRYYSGVALQPRFVSFTNIEDAFCSAYSRPQLDPRAPKTTCNRKDKDDCNYLHIAKMPLLVLDILKETYFPKQARKVEEKERRRRSRRRRSRSRSRGRYERRRSRSRSRSRSRNRKRSRSRSRNRYDKQINDNKQNRRYDDRRRSRSRSRDIKKGRQ